MKVPKEEIDEARAYAEETCRIALRPSQRLLPTEWISRNFGRLPIDFERFPWLREPCDCLADYRVEEQLFFAPPQVGKSIIAEGGTCYCIAEDPGDMVLYTHTIPLANTWAEQRVIPSIKQCRACQPYLPTDPRLIRKNEILMGHMVIEVQPANETQTQSRTRRIVYCDERNLWDSGRYDNARRRASSPDFDGRRKIASFGNSGLWESEWEDQWRQSDQRVIHALCPGCGKPAPFKFSEKKCRRVPAAVPGFTIVWEENDLTRPQGVWNLDEAAKTIRLQCPHCQTKLADTPKVRVTLRRTMHYVAMNPRASIKLRAWAVSGVACYPWEDLMRQFISANQQLDLGDDKPMREFMLKGINEPWSEDVIFDTTTNPTGDYDMTGQAWAESTEAAMTVDVQELRPYFWYLIRDWATVGGKSRLRVCGYCNTWEDLRAIQQAHQLPDPYVHVDCRYNTHEVHSRCAQWGWIALMGDDADFFIHSKGLKNPVRRYFSERRLVDPVIGTDQQGDPYRRRCWEVTWCNSPTKDILARLYTARGAYFGVPRDAPQYYLNHMASERKQIVRTQGSKEVRRWMKLGKRPNHLWDCEAMQIVFALMKGPLRSMAPDLPAASESAPGDTGH